MKKMLLSAALLGISSLAGAGSLSVNEVASVTAAAEYYNIEVTVQSRCYKTGTEAIGANASLEKAVEALLTNALKTSPAPRGVENPFTAVGGDVQRGKVISSARGAEKVLCSGWQTAKTLSAKLGSKDSLPKVQEEIYALVDKHVFNEEDSSAHTWLTFESPTPALSPATQERQEAEATKKAVAKATTKVKLLAEQCGLRGLKITSVSSNVQSQNGGVRKFAARAMMAESAESSPEGVFEFGKLATTVNVSLTCEFDGGEVTCPVK